MVDNGTAIEGYGRYGGISGITWYAAADYSYFQNFCDIIKKYRIGNQHIMLYIIKVKSL